MSEELSDGFGSDLSEGYYKNKREEEEKNAKRRRQRKRPAVSPPRTPSGAATRVLTGNSSRRKLPGGGCDYIILQPGDRDGYQKYMVPDEDALVGRGGYNTVHVIDSYMGNKYSFPVVIRFTKKGQEERPFPQTETEPAIQKKVAHCPSILGLLGYGTYRCYGDDKYGRYTIHEKADRIMPMFRSCKDVYLLTKTVSQLLSGLQCMHEARICHNDIKPANIMYSRREDEALYIDFGGANETGDAMSSWTRGFLDPTTKATGDKYSSEANDRWALGKTLLLLLNRSQLAPAALKPLREIAEKLKVVKPVLTLEGALELLSQAAGGAAVGAAFHMPSLARLRLWE